MSGVGEADDKAPHAYIKRNGVLRMNEPRFLGQGWRIQSTQEVVTAYYCLEETEIKLTVLLSTDVGKEVNTSAEDFMYCLSETTERCHPVKKM